MTEQFYYCIREYRTQHRLTHYVKSETKHHFFYNVYKRKNAIFKCTTDGEV